MLNMVSIQESNPIVFRDDPIPSSSSSSSSFSQGYSSRGTFGRRITSQNNQHQLQTADNARLSTTTTTELVRWPANRKTPPFYNSSDNLRVITIRRDNNDDQESDDTLSENRKTKPIIFPKKNLSSRTKVLLPNVDPNGLPVCVNSPTDTFCEQVDSYPKIDFKQEYGLDVEEFRDMFGSSELKGIDARKSYDRNHHSSDDDYYGERICDGIRKIIYPKMAKNDNKRWVYIVNDESEFRQHVVTEICGRVGTSCAYLEGNLPHGVTSQCRQKHAYVRLLALHPTEQRAYTDLFQFPSCCTCYIKNPFYGESTNNKSENQ